jgi:hypothetical protein
VETADAPAVGASTTTPASVSVPGSQVDQDLMNDFGINEVLEEVEVEELLEVYGIDDAG